MLSLLSHLLLHGSYSLGVRQELHRFRSTVLPLLTVEVGVHLLLEVRVLSPRDGEFIHNGT